MDKNDNKLVSIIIPVYNASKSIKDCVNSVLNQDYINIEVIIINDGSTDNSLHIIKSISDTDNRVKYINQKNFGRSHARNVGLKNSKGDYYLFLDADDLLLDNAITTLYNKILIDDSDIVLSGLKIFNKDIIHNLKFKFDNYDDVFSVINEIVLNYDERALWSQCAKLYSRKFIDLNIYFDEGLDIYEDMKYFFDVMLTKPKFSILYNCFYKYVKGDKRSTNTDYYKNYIFQKEYFHKLSRYPELVNSSKVLYFENSFWIAKQLFFLKKFNEVLLILTDIKKFVFIWMQNNFKRAFVEIPKFLYIKIFSMLLFK